jgi:predicted Mrr-cat superfamily restriction endonuclease
MKKLTLTLFTAIVLLVFNSGQLKADDEANKTPLATTNTAVNSSKTEAMEVRLNEIKAMDNSMLSSSEKKELRKETRSIKSEMKSDKKSAYIEGGHGGLYVSVGAVLLIILLLVLIL